MGRSQRAVQAERRVEHDARLEGLVDMHRDIVQAERADGGAEAAPQAAHQRIQQRQHQGAMGQVVLPAVTASAGAQFLVGQDQDGQESGPQQHQVPVCSGFVQQDLCDVVVVAELFEHRAGGAAVGIGEIDAVGQVDGQHEEVGHHEHPFGDAAVAFSLAEAEGQHGQQQIGEVGVEHRREVEAQAAPAKAQQRGAVHLREQGAVLEEKHQPAAAQQ